MSERSTRATATYGSWQSPMTAELIATGEVTLSGIHVDGDDVLWIEGRAAEQGRDVLVRAEPNGRLSDVTAAPTNVRSRVHEYGGAAYMVAGRTVWYSEFTDGRLYEIADERAATPRAITPPGDWRYADLALDRSRRRLVCIREDHNADTLTAHGEAINTLVAVPWDRGIVQVLVEGNDFYTSPRISPDGTQLAWLTWRHPNLPWNGTELWVGEFGSDGGIVNARQVAGGPDESIVQPRWSPEGVLYFISDRSNWWNLERLCDPGAAPGRQPLAPMAADVAGPDWWLGLSTYGFSGDGSILVVARADGRDRLLSINGRTLKVASLELPFVEIEYLQVRGDRAVFVAGSATEPASIVALDLPSGKLETLRATRDAAFDPTCVSVAEPITYPTTGGRTAHAFYYAPRSPAFEAPIGTLPPLIVHAHGGPTLSARRAFDGTVQYFTSRGFAYLDVDYGGSTGYGRTYREQLDGQWGVVDVDDCVYGARALVERGMVDPKRLAISGGSAGGFTVLAALAFRDMFEAGVSFFGITDLVTWARDTHKFESRYLERLIGPYPERADLYRDRSPANFGDRITCPVLVLQGLDDTIVPPSQAEQMVAAIRAKGLQVAYMPFGGEGHGFRQSMSIRRSLEAELSYYGQVFDFEPAGVPKTNLL